MERKVIEMLRKLLMTTTATALLCLPFVGAAAQNLQPQPDYDQDYMNNVRIDRYLDAEVWTNHLDGDFFVGDRVVINYRSSRDAFVAIYSVDSKGRVNLLFPTEPGQDNFVRGGVTNYLPGADDDFDLVVSGPEGVENIQIIASRERFPIPEWYPVSGLLCDWDDRHDFMDYLNGRYFVRYDGQKFAFDRTALYINEWEPTYYRPVYYPYYPSWTVCGNAYFDYPWGATVYVDGIYWGCTPLYIPRIYVGWHTITVYDHWGYCWEHSVHFSHYHTVILNRDIIRPHHSVVSKYKDVRSIGYRDPITNGYPDFKHKPSVVRKVTNDRGKTTNVIGGNADYKPTVDKRYVRGSTKLISTERGYETAGSVVGKDRRGGSSRTKSIDVRSKSTGGDVTTSKRRTTGSSFGSDSRTSDYGRVSSGSKRSSGNRKVDSGPAQKQSQDYYQKKSGSTKRKSSQPAVKTQRSKGGTKSKPSVKSRPPKKTSEPKKTGNVKPSTSKPRSSTKSTTTKTGGGKTKKGGGRKR